MRKRPCSGQRTGALFISRAQLGRANDRYSKLRGGGDGRGQSCLGRPFVPLAHSGSAASRHLRCLWAPPTRGPWLAWAACHLPQLARFHGTASRHQRAKASAGRASSSVRVANVSRRHVHPSNDTATDHRPTPTSCLMVKIGAIHGCCLDDSSVREMSPWPVTSHHSTVSRTSATKTWCVSWPTPWPGRGGKLLHLTLASG